jgi:hypothetical protein
MKRFYKAHEAEIMLYVVILGVVVAILIGGAK